jgi:hypothetical protein
LLLLGTVMILRLRSAQSVKRMFSPGSTSHFPFVVGPDYMIQSVINTEILRLPPTTAHFQDDCGTNNFHMK